MNKRNLHHLYVRLRPIKPKTLFMLFLVAGALSVYGLRSNNLRMIELREQVFVADERGEGVEKALNDLRSYVYGHMNTDLSSGGIAIKPPIQLKYTYERLIEEEQERVAAQNRQVTAQATRVCEARHPAGQIQARAACVQQYITDNSVKASASSVPKELYQFDFVSPRWSPDLAGFSLLATVGLFVLFITKLLLDVWFKRQLK